VRTNYVLIDYENVQPKDMALLNGHPVSVRVFAGANQTKVPLDVAKALQPLGANAEYIAASGSGRNALDFHIAFYLGELAVKDPEGFFHVITKDAGFDPLLAHLKSRGIHAHRSRTLCEMPILALPTLKSVDERVEAIVKDLGRRGNARPRRVKTLASTIHALFMKKLEQSEVDALVAELEKRGLIGVQDGKVSYP
jgi:PIN domain-containing protein